ncbi:uncharacterized protein LOC128884260 isoform X2 [Hylaeus volcanicus]|uniref:uncharacterized protein LOC128884260 isoform X2 n=1 Tax=Hylaeus volcanicus TaxID=313075 RepID=UPI0023B7F794|nr:uncharacterized protein LOC128884260 isoform X2 [Hylaeus volcanicus]
MYLQSRDSVQTSISTSKKTSKSHKILADAVKTSPMSQYKLSSELQSNHPLSMEKSKKEKKNSRETNVKALIQKFQQGVEIKAAERPSSPNVNNYACQPKSSNSSSERQSLRQSSHRVEYLKLGSTMSDDGYNGTAPIHSLDSFKECRTRSMKKGSISMYDWALRNPYNAVFRMDQESKATASTGVRRVIPKGSIARNSSLRPLHIFVGTWNTSYGEFLKESMLANPDAYMNHVSRKFTKTKALHDTQHVNNLMIGSLDKHYHMKREEVRKNYMSYLNNNKILSTFSSRELLSLDSLRKPNLCYSHSIENFGLSESDAELGCSIMDKDIHTSGSHTSSLCESKDRSEKSFRKRFYDIEPLSDWLTPGYDIYIIALQEVISDELLNAILIYLNRVNSQTFHRVHFNEQKISGLGDGAYMTLKSTLIACFLSEKCTEETSCVQVGSSKGISLSSLNGSKGAVSIILTIYGQVVCFISCHLPTGKPSTRVKARELIRRKLAQAYSGLSDVDPTDVFHHIVWAGDFNFRVQELPAVWVVNCLVKKDLESVCSFDELKYSEYNVDFENEGFEELPISFFPTYKKFVGRKPVDVNDPEWVRKQYNVNFKVRWYKRGKIEQRIPSWTDRILKWSHPDLQSCCLLIPKTYVACCPTSDNFLLDSDHSPVACGMIFTALDEFYALPPVMFQDCREKGVQIPVTDILKDSRNTVKLRKVSTSHIV